MLDPAQTMRRLLLSALCALVAQFAPAAAQTALSPQQRAEIERIVLGSPEVQGIFQGAQPRVMLGEPEPDKAEAQAYLTGERTQPPQSYVTALVFDPGRNLARRVIVAPGESRIIAIQQLSAAEVPFVEGDVTAAWELARRDPAVQRALGASAERFRVASPGAAAPAPEIVEALPLRSVDPNDPCSRDRCLDLVFRTPQGYLPFRAHVDLTNRSVALHGGGQHR
jgi:hypothetical protein